jgi:tRNA/tmRNA/rRNA uracil-C5-methylase (TrmA/RlmC/RlmD family)
VVAEQIAVDWEILGLAFLDDFYCNNPEIVVDLSIGMLARTSFQGKEKVENAYCGVGFA